MLIAEPEPELLYLFQFGLPLKMSGALRMEVTNEMAFIALNDETTEDLQILPYSIYRKGRHKRCRQAWQMQRRWSSA